METSRCNTETNKIFINKKEIQRGRKLKNSPIICGQYSIFNLRSWRHENFSRKQFHEDLTTSYPGVNHVHSIPRMELTQKSFLKTPTQRVRYNTCECQNMNYRQL